MRQGTVGDPIIDQFPVWEDDGIQKHSGLSVARFFTSVWQDGVPKSIPVGVVEISASGEYKVTFTPDALGFWKVEVFNDYSNEYWVAEVDVGTATISDLDADLKRILGLLHHNAFLDNQQYDSDGQMTSARLRVFTEASQVPDVPGGSETTGLLHEYSIEAEYSGVGAVSFYRLLRVL